jgi:hypothetical protein
MKSEEFAAAVFMAKRPTANGQCSMLNAQCSMRNVQ